MYLQWYLELLRLYCRFDSYKRRYILAVMKTKSLPLFSCNFINFDGKFDSERIKEGNIVPLQTGDGQRVNASVVEIKPDVVVVDLNHPLAGADLIFEGEIIESRPATNEEIQELVKMMSGEGCGCGCDSCGGGCGDNECDDCGCEGGHCHK